MMTTVIMMMMMMMMKIMINKVCFKAVFCFIECGRSLTRFYARKMKSGEQQKQMFYVLMQKIIV